MKQYADEIIVNYEPINKSTLVGKIDMTKNELLKLEKLATLTPKEIDQNQPLVFSQLSERAGLTLKASIENKLKTVPEEIKDSLLEVDFTPEKLGKLDIKSILIKNLAGTELPAGECRTTARASISRHSSRKIIA